MIGTYKLMMGKYDKAVANILPEKQDSLTGLATRGHSLKLFQQRVKKTLGQIFFFSTHVTSHGNNLPSSVLQAPSTKAFERRLDK